MPSMASMSFFSFMVVLSASICIVTVSIQYKHLLMILLALEALLLCLFGLILLSNWSSFESHLCLILLTMGVCEATMGLSILVSLVRSHGNDYVFSLSLHKC
uniref:NADH-ubiquinone oxidoreductase chain 4L n=1 Tax=Fissurella volcano TaxID=707972 RepID=H6V543_FISVO|nr:NADH dehydrogenase subunit 4L [Fissurella volcano]AFB78095.1 NADH dehydrogenase subunit 4L [Fissurella volcano]